MKRTRVFRSYPVIFSRARGSIMLTGDGSKVVDFLSGTGALNYGHNNHRLKAAIAEYLASEQLEFMETFNSVILRERDLQYRFQFTGPTGANAVEAAIKLDRKVTGRQNIITFTHGYHGTSLGAIAASGSRFYRATTGVSLSGVTFMPYDGYLGLDVDTRDYLQKLLIDESSGIDHPAAILLETVQVEGGINVARKEWLQSIQAIAKQAGALFIVDKIQMGCGRTGEFFSFEFAGLSARHRCVVEIAERIRFAIINVVDQGGVRGVAAGRTHRLVSTKQLCSHIGNGSHRSILAGRDQGAQRTGDIMRRRLDAIAVIETDLPLEAGACQGLQQLPHARHLRGD